MGMYIPMTLGSSGVSDVSSSSDISEGWTDRVCPVYVLSMSLPLALTVGRVYSSSLNIAGSWIRVSSSYQV